MKKYESEVSAWMIQKWTVSGGEWTTIKVYVYLTGLMGAAGIGYGRLTLTLKA